MKKNTFVKVIDILDYDIFAIAKDQFVGREAMVMDLDKNDDMISYLGTLKFIDNGEARFFLRVCVEEVKE